MNLTCRFIKFKTCVDTNALERWNDEIVETKMQNTKNLYLRTKQEADMLLALQIMMFGVTSLAYAVHSRLFEAVVFGILFCYGLAIRILKGTFIAPAIVEITDEQLIFRDTAFFQKKVTLYLLSDIQTISLVGTKNRRKVRVLLKNGQSEDFFALLFAWGPVTPKRIINFLWTSLPTTIPFTEEEPAS